MIRKAIEENIHIFLEKGARVCIYPFGEFGLKTKQILNECFGIQEYLILDNGFCKTNKNIKPVEYLAEIDTSEMVVLFTAANPEVKDIVKANLLKYCDEGQIIDIFPDGEYWSKTICGKYSYGPLCDHWAG